MTTIERYHLPEFERLPRVLGQAYADGKMTILLAQLNERGPSPRILTATYLVSADDGLQHFVRVDGSTITRSSTFEFSLTFSGNDPMAPRFE